MNARQMMTAIAATRDTPAFSGRCRYCGARCYGRACPSHRDLVAHEHQMMRSSAPITPYPDAIGAPTEGV